MEIRSAVRENRLSDPGSVTRDDYDHFVDGNRVWVFEDRSGILGFSAADDRDGTIWALFVDPAHEGRGIGRALLARACLDLAADGHATARLTTTPGTRADRLYRKLGWQDLGQSTSGETIFERPL
jgi:GNAT superfamily N-acetyltransferase